MQIVSKDPAASQITPLNSTSGNDCDSIDAVKVSGILDEFIDTDGPSNVTSPCPPIFSSAPTDINPGPCELSFSELFATT